MDSCLRSLSRRGAKAASVFHFFNLYQCCPRKFFIKYACRIVPRYVAEPLVQGGAFHEGVATFYTTKSEKKALSVAMSIIDESRPELESEELYEKLIFRVKNMLHFWIAEMGASDLRTYKFLGVERQLIVPIEGTPYSMTIRPDAVVEDKHSGLVYILEHKTSGFSIRVTDQAVFLGDQATSYVFGTQKIDKIGVFGVIPDICYWNKNTEDVKNLKCERGTIATRDAYAVRAFEKGVAQILTEINQKIEAYKQGHDPWFLFPRNSHYCTSFSKPCEFASICYTPCEKLKKLPPDFIRDKTARRLTGLVEDSIAIT